MFWSRRPDAGYSGLASETATMGVDSELVAFVMTMSAAIVCVALCLPAESERESVGGALWRRGHDEHGNRCYYNDITNERTYQPPPSFTKPLTRAVGPSGHARSAPAHKSGKSVPQRSTPRNNTVTPRPKKRFIPSGVHGKLFDEPDKARLLTIAMNPNAPGPNNAWTFLVGRQLAWRPSQDHRNNRLSHAMAEVRVADSSASDDDFQPDVWWVSFLNTPGPFSPIAPSEPPKPYGVVGWLNTAEMDEVMRADVVAKHWLLYSASNQPNQLLSAMEYASRSGHTSTITAIWAVDASDPVETLEGSFWNVVADEIAGDASHIEVQVYVTIYPGRLGRLKAADARITAITLGSQAATEGVRLRMRGRRMDGEICTDLFNRSYLLNYDNDEINIVEHEPGIGGAPTFLYDDDLSSGKEEAKPIDKGKQLKLSPTAWPEVKASDIKFLEADGSDKLYLAKRTHPHDQYCQLLDKRRPKVLQNARPLAVSASLREYARECGREFESFLGDFLVRDAVEKYAPSGSATTFVDVTESVSLTHGRSAPYKGLNIMMDAKRGDADGRSYAGMVIKCKEPHARRDARNLSLAMTLPLQYAYRYPDVPVWPQVGPTCWLHATINMVLGSSLRDVVREHCQVVTQTWADDNRQTMPGAADIIRDTIGNGIDHALERTSAGLTSATRGMPSNVARCVLMLAIIESTGALSSFQSTSEVAMDLAYVRVSSQYNRAIANTILRDGFYPSRSAHTFLTGLTSVIDAMSLHAACYKSAVNVVDLANHQIFLQERQDYSGWEAHSESVPKQLRAQSTMLMYDAGIGDIAYGEMRHSVGLSRDESGNVFVAESGGARPLLPREQMSQTNHIDKYLPALSVTAMMESHRSWVNSPAPVITVLVGAIVRRKGWQAEARELDPYQLGGSPDSEMRVGTSVFVPGDGYLDEGHWEQVYEEDTDEDTTDIGDADAEQAADAYASDARGDFDTDTASGEGDVVPQDVVDMLHAQAEEIHGIETIVLAYLAHTMGLAE